MSRHDDRPLAKTELGFAFPFYQQRHTVAHLSPTDAMREYVELVAESDSSFLFEEDGEDDGQKDGKELPPDILAQLEAQHKSRGISLD